MGGGTGTLKGREDPPSARPGDVSDRGWAAETPRRGLYHPKPPLSGSDLGRRRFTLAAVGGVAAVSIPYLWVLFGPWQAPYPLRALLQGNFYDLQARAMLHGHLAVAKAPLGVEAWIHDGRTYTYFGLFPSILRMPVLALTNSLDSRLTVPSMLLAWIVTAIFSALLLWRVRLLLRGQGTMGWAEAGSFGLLLATILGGSVLVYLAATPFVFDEDLAWSVALTIGAVFALLGVLERPSWKRVLGSGLLVLAANLDRVTTGYACVGAAVLAALWFGLGRGGTDRRKWCFPMLAVGVVPFAVACAVNYAKFGVFVGLPVTDQLYSSVDTYRKRFLAANGNSEVGLQFAPSTALAYLRPDGIRFTSIFPYVTLPAAPAKELGGILFDRRYRTASVPSSMPYLFVLTLWGIVTAFRRRAVGRVGLARIPLLAAAVAASALLAWGYIGNRYLADFVPLLVLASAVAMADIWRRLAHSSPARRRSAAGILGLLALLTVYMNLAIAVTPNEEWTATQVFNYVRFQKSVSDMTGHPLNGYVRRGSTLPQWAPADELFVIGDCDGLYVSNGEDYSTAPPSLSKQVGSWMTVELGRGFQHTLAVTFTGTPSTNQHMTPLIKVGSSTISMVTTTASAGHVEVWFTLQAPGYFARGLSSTVTLGSTHKVVIVTDTAIHSMMVTLAGGQAVPQPGGGGFLRTLASSVVFSRPLSGSAPAVVLPSPTGPSATVSYSDVTRHTPGPAICEGLVR